MALRTWERTLGDGVSLSSGRGLKLLHFTPKAVQASLWLDDDNDVDKKIYIYIPPFFPFT